MPLCFNMLTRIIHIHRSVFTLSCEQDELVIRGVFTLSCEQDELVIRGVLIRCVASLLLALNIRES